MATENFFSSVDNQNREDVLNQEKVNFPERSVFPYGCADLHTLNEGYLVPVDTFFVLPGDSLDIEFAAYLETLNPFVERQYSGMKLSIHAYYQKCEHEWRGWKNYATKGRRGNISLSLPSLGPAGRLMINGIVQTLTGVAASSNIAVNFDTPNSLISHMVGIVQSHVPNQPRSASVTGSAVQALLDSHDMGDNTQVNRSFRITGETNSFLGVSSYRFNAIPFSMYQRIYRDFYMNQNLCRDNNLWFPDDDDNFCLPYQPSALVYSVGNSTYAVDRFQLVPNNNPHIANPVTQQDKCADAPVLAAMRCRQFNGDPFTTSVPFLERNGTTQLMLPSFVGDYYKVLEQMGSLSDFGLKKSTTSTSAAPQLYGPTANTDYMQSKIDVSSYRYSYFSLLSMQQLQELAASTLWSRRNAQARGDYNSLIKAHYGRNPNSEDRSATYLGGSVQRLEFDNVVSQVGTTTQPLGSLTSIAKSGGRGKINHFEVPDFGYVMIIASLIPDTYYTQGLRPEFDVDMTGVELPYPEFANLPKEPLLSKRLFYSADNSVDMRLLAYQERFLDYKYRPNRLFGHFADYMDSKFLSMTFGRYFNKAQIQAMQSIDNEFVTMSPYALRKDMYSVPSQPHFVLQFGDNVRLVRCLPYAAKESTFTNVA